MKLVTRLVGMMFIIAAATALIVTGGGRSSTAAAMTLGLVVALAAAVMAARALARPVVAVADAAGDIANGAAPRFPRSGTAEIDALVLALRRMHSDTLERAAQLEQARAGATAIVDAMVEGVLTCDARGRIDVANPAARRLLAYAPDAALPDLPVLFRDTEARDAVDRVLQGEEVNDCELTLDNRTLLLNARPLAGAGAVLVLHDLTAIRRLEAVRRDFVANVSHELKTPLTSITGYAETLRDPAIDATLRLQFVQTILTNARRMHTLVDDLLDLSRIESGTWIPQPVLLDVDTMVREARESLAVAADARQVEFATAFAPDALQIRADRDAVRQILANLFDNALRYVSAGGQITVRTARRDHGTLLSVEDNGSGIGADHLERIFERFYRVDPARSRDAGGTGLGLSIVRHLVDAHHGWVRAESELQLGTTIHCWFPD